MSAETIIRVKRKREEEPLDELVVVERPSKRVHIDLDAPATPAVAEPEAPIAKRVVYRRIESVKGRITESTARNMVDKIRARREQATRTRHPHVAAAPEARKQKQRQGHQKDILKARRQTTRLRRAEHQADLEAFDGIFRVVDLVEDTSDPSMTGHIASAPAQRQEQQHRQVDRRERQVDRRVEQEIMCNYMPMVREYLDSEEFAGSDIRGLDGPLDAEDDADYDYFYRDDTAVAGDDDETPEITLEPFNVDTYNVREYYHEDEDPNAKEWDYPDEGECSDHFEMEGSSSVSAADSSGSEDFSYQRRAVPWRGGMRGRVTRGPGRRAGKKPSNGWMDDDASDD